MYYFTKYSIIVILYLEYNFESIILKSASVEIHVVAVVACLYLCVHNSTHNYNCCNYDQRRFSAFYSQITMRVVCSLKLYLKQKGTYFSTYNYWHKKYCFQVDVMHDLVPISILKKERVSHTFSCYVSSDAAPVPHGLRAHFASDTVKYSVICCTTVC